MKFLSVVSTFLCASGAVATLNPVRHHPFHKRAVAEPLIEKREANKPFRNAEIQKRASGFLNDNSKPFEVNGTGIPEVPFDIGESYAGLLPISSDPNETRKLFFWFFPASAVTPPQEVVIWLNGGPGCSSLSGLLTENGPFTWEDGTLAPVQNPYSWNNITNMLWVEQPVGVGYSVGTPNITNEVELGLEFLGFYKNFVDTFQTYNYTTYVTGESYAGMYVPYIADALITANDTKYFNLGGIAINDPVIGDSTAQEQVIILPFVEYWQNIMYLNDSFMAEATQRQKDCGYADYLDKYLQFPPPPGPFPVLPDPYASPNYTCDQFDNFLSALLEVNPCFNLYHISETCPHPYSQLGIINPGDYVPPGAEVYFNRTDVKQALHAPLDSNWQQCTDINVFGNGNDSSQTAQDTSKGPATNGVLQRVIEHTNNVFIGSGDLDMILPTNGSLLAIQNMTWNGVQGLSEYPSTPLYVPYHPEYNGGALAGAGIAGVWHSERGLTFYTAHLAGHEVPGYAPSVGLRMLEILLGHVKDFSATDNFVGQTGNYTGTSPILKHQMQWIG